MVVQVQLRVLVPFSLVLVSETSQPPRGVWPCNISTFHLYRLEGLHMDEFSLIHSFHNFDYNSIFFDWRIVDVIFFNEFVMISVEIFQNHFLIRFGFFAVFILYLKFKRLETSSFSSRTHLYWNWCENESCPTTFLSNSSSDLNHIVTNQSINQFKSYSTKSWE